MLRMVLIFRLWNSAASACIAAASANRIRSPSFVVAEEEVPEGWGVLSRLVGMRFSVTAATIALASGTLQRRKLSSRPIIDSNVSQCDADL